jgi:DNA repair photolyase
MRRASGPGVRLCELSPMRLGKMRVSESQLPLLPLPVRASSPLPVLDSRVRGTRFLGIEVRSAVNSPAATHMGFWSLNPYIGCEFGCTYCYARNTHRWTVERLGERAPPRADFERDILVKTNIAEVLHQELDPSKLVGESLAIGTATDPYQPAEREFRLTRRILEALLSYRGVRLSITTKSPLVTRDTDILNQLRERHEVSVNMSLATLNPRLARRLEARTAVPAARLRAIERLTAAGIRAGIFVMPVLPRITDGRRELDRLLAAAKEAGARFAAWSALRLGPAARRHFLPHLAREFPELMERYERHYARQDTAGWAYRQALESRFQALRRKHGLGDFSEG